MADCVVRSRIDPAVKEEAKQIFKKMGISLSDGIRLFLHQVVTDKALPLEVKIPNLKTMKYLDTSGKEKQNP